MPWVNVVLVDLTLQKLKVEVILVGRVSLKAISINSRCLGRDKINAILPDKAVGPALSNVFIGDLGSEISYYRL